jgi:hypothetical protein
MERKLDVGGILSQVFSTYSAQAGVLLPVAFCLYLLVAVIDVLLAGSLALVPIVLAVSVIAATLYQGMVVGLVRDVQDGRRDSSVEDLIRATGPVVLPLIGVGLLAGIAIGIGFLLLVVPGLILLTIWAVIAPVIVVERTGVMAAFGRSRELVRGNGWQVFGVIVVVYIIVFFANAIFGAIGSSISDAAVVRIVFSLIASTLTAPISALVAAVIYFRLLAIKQGAGSVPADPGPAPADPGAPPPPPPPPPAGTAPA